MTIGQTGQATLGCPVCPLVFAEQATHVDSRFGGGKGEGQPPEGADLSFPFFPHPIPSVTGVSSL